MKQKTTIIGLSVMTLGAATAAPLLVKSAPAPTLGGWFIGSSFGQNQSDSNFARIANSADPSGYGFAFLASGYTDTGDEGYGDEGYGDEGYGDEGYGDEGYGDEGYGDEGYGDEGYNRPANRQPLASGVDGDHYSISDFDFNIYSLQIGRDLGAEIFGCNLAAYIDLSIIDGNARMGFFESGPTLTSSEVIDVQMYPITFNLRAERALFGGIHGYLTGGAGYALTEAEFLDEKQNTGGFIAQASIGLSYALSSQWAIFGGARWIYFNELDLGYDVDIQDSVGYEAGIRLNF